MRANVPHHYKRKYFVQSLTGFAREVERWRDAGLQVQEAWEVLSAAATFFAFLRLSTELRRVRARSLA